MVSGSLDYESAVHSKIIFFCFLGQESWQQFTHIPSPPTQTTRLLGPGVGSEREQNHPLPWVSLVMPSYTPPLEEGFDPAPCGDFSSRSCGLCRATPQAPCPGVPQAGLTRLGVSRGIPSATAGSSSLSKAMHGPRTVPWHQGD